MKLTFTLLILIFSACSSSDDSNDNSACEKYVYGFESSGQDNYQLLLLNKELWDLAYACQEDCAQEIEDRLENEYEVVNVNFNTYSYYFDQSTCPISSCYQVATEICWEGAQ